MSRTSDYWRDREREWLEQYLKEEAKYAKDVQAIYDYMLDEIEKEINDNFKKYASKEGISMAEAKKRAEKIDIEAYMRKAEKYVKAAEADRAAAPGKPVSKIRIFLKIFILPIDIYAYMPYNKAIDTGMCPKSNYKITGGNSYD